MLVAQVNPLALLLQSRMRLYNCAARNRWVQEVLVDVQVKGGSHVAAMRKAACWRRGLTANLGGSCTTDAFIMTARHAPSSQQDVRSPPEPCKLLDLPEAVLARILALLPQQDRCKAAHDANSCRVGSA